MTLRKFPIETPEPASEIVPLDEVARRLNVSLPTLRRWIKADLVDGKQRVPGCRGEGSAYRVVRAIFERAMRDGHEPNRAPAIVNPDLSAIAHHLRQRAADDLALADEIDASQMSARQQLAS